MDVGVVGLGVMGGNIVLNIEDKGYTVGIFNRTSQKTTDFCGKNTGKNIKGFYDLASFVSSLKTPRKILLMITAGAAVDKAVESLLPFLDPMDVVVDGGNSFFEDTERRCRRYNGRLLFLGCGISGGELGARHGPSMMVGGDQAGWCSVKEMFLRIAARAGEKSCCGYLGLGGSGHLIKMVHNGIEYCEMELLAETYLFLKTSGYRNQEIARIMGHWLTDECLNGYLLEICIAILEREDDVIDTIEDKANQKGTGMQCVLTGARNGIPVTVMGESVFARLISSRSSDRDAFAARVQEGSRSAGIGISDLENGLVMAKCIAYAQGFDMITACGEAYGWKFDLQEVCSLWKGGCILRGGFLNVVERMAAERAGSLSLSAAFISMHKKKYESLKKVVTRSIEAEVPVPALSSALSYINGLKTKRGGGSLIQAMRDYFGGHTVSLVGEEGNVHIEWYKEQH